MMLNSLQGELFVTESPSGWLKYSLLLQGDLFIDELSTG